MSQPIITQAELETPRSAADMHAWVDEAARRFNTKELKAQAREGRYFAKELFAEARPMALFAHRYYEASPAVVVQHVIGNQNFDGIIVDKRTKPAPIQYLEVTTTLMTYEDSLRMELLNTQGHAPAFGAISAVGPKHRRVAIRARSEAHEHAAIVGQHLRSVADAVLRKAAKAYEPKTALIVAVDDYLAFRECSDIAELDRVACETLLPALCKTNFILLALVGSNSVHLTYPV